MKRMINDCGKTVALFSVVIIAVLAGCAVRPAVKPEKALRKRVEGFMQARVDQKWEAVYNYYVPAYRKSMPVSFYVNRQKKRIIKGYRIEGIKILPSGKEAIVKSRVDPVMKGYVFKNAPEKLTWVREHGKWFVFRTLAPHKPGIPRRGN